MAGLIATVTLNLALDVTYEVDALVVGGSHRVDHIRRRAGGKGVNVARVATTLGHQVLAFGFVGGVTGELVAEELFDAGLTALLTPIAAKPGVRLPLSTVPTVTPPSSTRPARWLARTNGGLSAIGCPGQGSACWPVRAASLLACPPMPMRNLRSAHVITTYCP